MEVESGESDENKVLKKKKQLEKLVEAVAVEVIRAWT